MRWLILAILLSGCGGDQNALRYVATDAPMWNLNPGMWDASTNAITTAPTLPINVGPQSRR